MKVAEKIQARRLRYQGKSLNIISKTLKIAKSTASLWCKDITLTKQQEDILLRNKRGGAGALANKIKRQKELMLLSIDARREYSQRTLDPSDKAFIDTGLALYWAEGGKKTSVDVTNSDPELIKYIMKWFRKIIHVPEERFRVSVYYHQGQNEQAMKQYWSEVTHIPLNQFRKSIFKKEGTGHRKNILYNGTCKIRISDRNLLHKILIWVECMYLGR